MASRLTNSSLSSGAQSLLDFPISESNPVQFPGPPPASSEVVIIGGGIIGITTALFIARKGVAVTVVEKGRIAGEQSSRNWGWIRKQGRDADELPIVIEAARLWKQLAEECGEDIGLTQCGVTYLARTDREMAAFDEFMKIASTYGLDTKLLDTDDVDTLIPHMARRFAGAMTTPSDLRAEPWVAVPALARLASSTSHSSSPQDAKEWAALPSCCRAPTRRSLKPTGQAQAKSPVVVGFETMQNLV